MRVDKIPPQSAVGRNQSTKAETKEQKAEKRRDAAAKKTVKSNQVEKNDMVNIDLEALVEVKKEAEKANSRLRAVVKDLLQRQGMTFKDALADPEQVEVDQKAVEEAESLLAEDGEFGVEAVSDRIVNFAKAISGGDKERYEELKAAIKEGFAQAKEALGGSLPEISEKTFEEPMEKLENWAKN